MARRLVATTCALPAWHHDRLRHLAPMSWSVAVVPLKVMTKIWKHTHDGLQCGWHRVWTHTHTHTWWTTVCCARWRRRSQPYQSHFLHAKQCHERVLPRAPGSPVRVLWVTIQRRGMPQELMHGLVSKKNGRATWHPAAA